MTNNRKKAWRYTPFTSAEKLAPSLLLALALPFTIFFFGPFEAYANNIDELGFAFGDFGLLSLAVAFLLGVIVFFVMWNLPGRVFDITYAVLFALSVMLYLQGNFLNLGLNAVEGDGVGNATYTTTALVINLFVWLLVIAGAVLAVLMIRRQRDLMRLISIVALVVVVGIQVMMFLLLSMTTDVFTPLDKRGTDTEGSVSESATMPGILTNAGITEVGEDGNVIVIVVDRFDLDFHNAILKNDPDFYAALEGFTLYDNHITKYARTYPAITYMLTGVENDYSTSRPKYFEKAYTEGTFLKELSENGYNVKLYTDDFYAYENANVLSDYVENVRTSNDYFITSKVSLWGDMIRLTLFRYLPIAAKGAVGMLSSSDFNRHVIYDTENPMYEPDMKLSYEWLTEEAMSMRDGKNFTFLHIDGCHTPNKYYEDFTSIPEDSSDIWSTNIAMKISFQFVEHFISELKRLGLYEDATIIITGDHASAHSDTTDISGERVTTLLVKRKGESEGALKVNHAPVEQGQLRATIFESEGITPKNDYGTSIFATPENSDVVRYYHFQKTTVGGDDEIVVYAVRGDAKNFANWEIVERINVGDLYK